MPPMPPWKHGENIFAGPKLGWVDPYSPAHLKGMMAEKKDHDPALAALYNKIADNGGAEWIGDWTPNVGRYVGKRADMILKSRRSPLLRHLQRPQARLRPVLGRRLGRGRQVQEVDHRLRDQPGEPARGGHPRARLARPPRQEDG